MSHGTLWPPLSLKHALRRQARDFVQVVLPIDGRLAVGRFHGLAVEAAVPRSVGLAGLRVNTAEMTSFLPYLLRKTASESARFIVSQLCFSPAADFPALARGVRRGRPRGARPPYSIA